MKNLIIFTFCFLSILTVSPFLIYGAPAQESGASFSDVEEKEWILAEVRSSGKTVYMDRLKMNAEGMGEFYTIYFKKDETKGPGNEARGLANGTGAPNRYFGPYSIGGNRSLSFGNLASTMMMAFREPEGLRENEYFSYLSGISRWDLREGRLELSGSDGGAVLVFSH